MLSPNVTAEQCVELYSLVDLKCSYLVSPAGVRIHPRQTLAVPLVCLFFFVLCFFHALMQTRVLHERQASLRRLITACEVVKTTILFELSVRMTSVEGRGFFLAEPDRVDIDFCRVKTPVGFFV